MGASHSPDDGVDDVDFFLDSVFERREKNPAFDFKGGSALIGNAWGTPEVDDGEHTILAKLLLLDGSTVEVSATFNVLNNAPPPGGPSCEVRVRIDGVEQWIDKPAEFCQ